MSSAGLFLFRDFLIVLVPDDSPPFKGRQFSRLNSLHDLLLKLLYRSVFHFIEQLKVINRHAPVPSAQWSLALDAMARNEAGLERAPGTPGFASAEPGFALPARKSTCG